MTTYFVGDELDCYSIYTANVRESTQISLSGFSRGCVLIPNSSTDYVDAPLTDSVTGAPTATNDVLWMHFRRYNETGSTGRTPTQFFDNAGVVKVQEIVVSGGGTKIQFWNGSAFVDVIPNFATNNSTATWDIRIKIAVAGIIELFKEGVLMTRYEGDTTGIGNIAKVRFNSNGSNTNAWHQLVLADYSTVNHTIRRRTPTGNGANAGWTGDFSLIDDAPSTTIGSDAITADASGLKSTFTAAALAATAGGHVIKAVAVAEFSRNDGTGQAPQNVRPVLRVSTTDYEGPVNAPIDAGWRGGVAFWENNPATGAAWASIADVNATEFGIVSKD